MNTNLEKLADKAAENVAGANHIPNEFCEEFAKLLAKEFIAVIEFHGSNEDVPYLHWMLVNKFGINLT